MAIILTVIFVSAIAVGLFFLLRNRHKHAANRRAAHSNVSQHYGTGSLNRLSENKFFWGAELWQPGCTQSYKLLGRQFRFADAPDIPLEGCNRDTCTCRFKGLRERRSRPRRLNPDRRSEVRFSKTHPDRRTRGGRRRDDLWIDHSL